MSSSGFLKFYKNSKLEYEGGVHTAYVAVKTGREEALKHAYDELKPFDVEFNDDDWVEVVTDGDAEYAFLCEAFE